MAMANPPETSIPNDVDALRAEVERLRALVGPDEASYQQLRVDLWAARDAAFGAEMAAGELRGQVKVLEGEVVRAQRNSKWLKARLKAPLRRIKGILRGA
jgi:predicted  nucleic acid-binding Zn-ribbon protein